MFAAAARAFAQIPDPAFQRVLWRAFGWSMAIFCALLALAWWGLVSTRLFDFGWLEALVDALGWVAALIVAALLFPAIAVVVVSFMLEDIARAVEARHYPALGPARAQGLSEAVAGALRLAVIALVLNILALPLYLIPGLNVFVFYGMNGYLLGREYFELVGCRRFGSAATRALRRRYRGRLWLAGVGIAFLLSIPFVGWTMPMVATAFALHLFESLRQRAGAVDGADGIGSGPAGTDRVRITDREG